MSLRPLPENERARKLRGAALVALCLFALATAGAALQSRRVSARTFVIVQQSPTAPAQTTQGIRTNDAGRGLQLKIEHVNGREVVAGEAIVRFRDALATSLTEAV